MVSTLVDHSEALTLIKPYLLMKLPDAVYLQNDAKEKLRSLIAERYPNKSKKERIILGYRFRQMFPNSCKA